MFLQYTLPFTCNLMCTVARTAFIVSSDCTVLDVGYNMCIACESNRLKYTQNSHNWECGMHLIERKFLHIDPNFIEVGGFLNIYEICDCLNYGTVDGVVSTSRNVIGRVGNMSTNFPVKDSNWLIYIWKWHVHITMTSFKCSISIFSAT